MRDQEFGKVKGHELHRMVENDDLKAHNLANT